MISLLFTSSNSLYSPGKGYNPKTIRRPLLPENLNSDDLPSSLETIRFVTPTISNWSGFYSDLTLPGATQTLHFPLMRHNLPHDLLIVFRPSSKELAVLALTRSVDLSKLPFLKEKLL